MRHKSLLFRLAALVLGIMLLTVFATISALHYSVREEFNDVRDEVLTSHDASQNALIELARELQADVGAARETARKFAERTPDGPAFLLLDAELAPIYASNELFSDAVTELDWLGRMNVSSGASLGGRRSFELVTNHFEEIRTNDGETAAYLIALPPPPPVTMDAGTFATEAWMRIAIWLALILAVGMALSAVVLSWAVRPIDRLTDAALILNSGRIPDRLEDPSIAELETLFEAFNSATATIGKTAALRKQMIADVAHELRTPITNLRSQIEAFDAGLIDDREALATTLTGELTLLERLVDDFQQLALSESGQLRISLLDLDLADFASSIVSGMAEQSGFSVKDDLDGPIMVSGDPDRIQQVLLNLVENALRHRQEGLIVQLEPIADGVRRGIRFSDNGPGIAEGANERIFQRFYRGEISREQDAAGAGLGLTIARSLMEAMGGTITAAPSSANADVGAQFELLFRESEEAA